jgi:hypothetical protein
MKAMTIELPDDVYERVQGRAAERGVSPQQEVVEIVSRFSENGNGDSLAAARVRMQQLFDSVHGFRLIPRITREELYERGRVH